VPTSNRSQPQVALNRADNVLSQCPKTSPEGSAGVLNDDVDYSLVPYTRRTAIETIGSHAVAVAATPLLLWLTSRFIPEAPIYWAPAAAWYGLLVVNIVVTTLLSLHAVRAEHTIDQTDRWDPIVATVSLAGLFGVASVAGGLKSPIAALPLLLVPYASGTYANLLARIFGLLLAGAVGIVGLVSHSWNGTGVAWGVALMVAYAVISVMSDALIVGLYRERAAAAIRERQLAEDVARLAHTVTLIAAGDLSTSLTTASEEGDAPSRVDTLSSAVKETIEALRTLVGHIQSGGLQMSDAAKDLLATAEEHAVAAAQQSSAVMETSSMLEELAAAAGQIAASAAAVEQQAAQALDVAGNARNAVTTSVAAMEGISVRVDEIASQAAALGAKGEQIDAILQVIDDLAEQTNLLALNAAIEAARAGQHGRGFSVVASEVRKLAERATESTAQIKDIVCEIQRETKTTIAATQEGANEVHRGVDVAHSVFDALQQISTMVAETSNAAREISMATQQQRSASEQVATMMSQVAEIARQYATGSQQSAASAAQLNELGATLRAAIAQFRLE
jgi:methyl-accepting chemotaxis protein